MQRSPIVFLFSSFFVLLSLIVFSSACTTTKAASAKREPLVVPPAPPRVIAPVEEPQDESVTGVEREPVPPLPKPPRSRESGAARSTEPKPPQQGAPGPTEAESQVKPQPSAPAPPVTPAPELRTIDTPDPAQAHRSVKDTIERAGRTLAQIDYGRLPKSSQLQYDMAKRFIEQADEALKAKNFTAAQLMADKAETIAKELSGR